MRTKVIRGIVTQLSVDVMDVTMVEDSGTRYARADKCADVTIRGDGYEVSVSGPYSGEQLGQELTVTIQAAEK